jgi:hypothetical protein
MNQINKTTRINPFVWKYYTKHYRLVFLFQRLYVAFPLPHMIEIPLRNILH